MPKYFFHTTNGKRSTDAEGIDLPSPSAAQTAAIKLAGELLKDAPDLLTEAAELKVVHSTRESVKFGNRARIRGRVGRYNGNAIRLLVDGSKNRIDISMLTIEVAARLKTRERKHDILDRGQEVLRRQPRVPYRLRAALVPVVFELIQHVAEDRIGMYENIQTAKAAESHPLR